MCKDCVTKICPVTKIRKKKYLYIYTNKAEHKPLLKPVKCKKNTHTQRHAKKILNLERKEKKKEQEGQDD